MQARGFTLIEMVIAIVLVGIIAGIAVAYFDGQQTQYSVYNQAHKLASNIRYIQLQAMTQKKPLRININSDHYTLTDLNGNPENRSALREGNSLSLSDISLSTNLPNDCLTFDKQGEAFTSCQDTSTALTSTHTITLTRDDFSRVIEITSHSGSVWLS